MNTHNVNTAASESSKTWIENLKQNQESSHSKSYEAPVLATDVAKVWVNNPDLSHLSQESIESLEQSISQNFPGGIKRVMVPSMTDQQINNLSYLELHALALQATYLLSTGFFTSFKYSKEYLNKFKDAHSKKYEQVIKDGYKVIEAGQVVAYFGYVRGRGSYGLIMGEPEQA